MKVCIDIIVNCHLYCFLTNPNSNTTYSKMKLQIAALFALVAAADAGVSYPTVAVSIYFRKDRHVATAKSMFHEFAFHAIVICACMFNVYCIICCLIYILHLTLRPVHVYF